MLAVDGRTTVTARRQCRGKAYVTPVRRVGIICNDFIRDGIAVASGQ